MKVEVALWMDRDEIRRVVDLLARSGICNRPDPASQSLSALRDALWAAYAREHPKCVVCGAEMVGSSERRRTCSDRCRQRLSRSGRRHTPAVTFSAPGLQLLFAVGDLVGLVGYEQEQEPLGEITAFAGFLEEEFTNDYGEVIPAGPVYEVTCLDGTDIRLPESKLIIHRG